MEKLSKLLFVLYERTKQEIVPWQETADDEIFQFSMPDSTVCIENHEGLFEVSIIDHLGREVERASSSQLDRSVDLDIPFDGPSSHREIMQSLYAAARRRALNTDATLDGILSRLGASA